MSVIYRPKGMAREYSPYALNIYIGCSHRCKYCYAPHTLQRRGEDYFGKPEPNWAKYLEDCVKLLRPTGKQVYYKFCLRKLAPNVELLPQEKNPYEYIVRYTPPKQTSLFE